MARCALLVLVVVLAAAAQVHAARISLERKSQQQLKQWTDRPVKNAAPLIGILTQPCEFCPGR